MQTTSAWVQLPFLQEAVRSGGTGGDVTQFNVFVNDPTRMDEIAADNQLAESKGVDLNADRAIEPEAE